MKKLLLFFVVLFSFSTAQWQTYTYKPLNLDTSSFWVHEYRNYSGGAEYPQYNVGEILSYVEKDTIIGSFTYFKIVGYVTKITTLELPTAFGPDRLYQIYLREDIVNRKIYRWLGAFDTLYVDYSLNLGDTLQTDIYNSLLFANGFVVNQVDTF